ncbi:DUF4124 domain-containing protein [Chitinimonas sp. PSY-7]|uniref:DUF4124 domain-containing protein n=1 Tax=Chitinimonas sp. PSY-7 TaxID=3459088 RepID=UPI0040400F28
MRRLLLIALFALSPLSHASSVYQWKDASGNVIFSDQPPPNQQAQKREIKTNVMQTSGGNFNTREAMRNNPVTLWSNSCGQACDDARSMLSKRGIAYSLRNPEASATDYDLLKKLVGSATVPVLQVGSKTLTGFNAGAWASALDEAGYKTPDPTVKGGATPADKGDNKASANP